MDGSSSSSKVPLQYYIAIQRLHCIIIMKGNKRSRDASDESASSDQKVTSLRYRGACNESFFTIIHRLKNLGEWIMCVKQIHAIGNKSSIG